ncbi:MAG: stage II sporulation protein P [Ruminococcus sp.]|nr:stage II sporulation protein P [Ruminococcus sp.]MDE7098305.1 stage II sporulation protein P [Ruminococcus sp.]
MTRFKRRKITGAVRCILLMLVPFCTAGIAKGIPFIKSAVSKMEHISVGGTAEKSVEKSDYYSLSHENTSENILSGKTILSEGYGIAEEEFPSEVRLQSPLDMTNDNAGEKPYPKNEDWTKGIDIVRTTYGEYSGTSFFSLSDGGQVNNKTSISNQTLIEESRLFPDFTISDTDEPQVLIYHTHTTESFEPFVRENLDANFNYRTTDSTKNMIMVGNAIQAELEARGIGVIHVTEIHDYPSYNGSYGRSRESIVPILEQYPTIKVALDIHRDAISNDSFAAQPYIEIDGKEAAQIMIISGCDDGTLDMPNYMKNFHFACSLQQQLENDYAGLTRPILFDYRHYNQDLTTGSLLIEVGSHGNTLEQVQYSGQLIGRSLSNLLNRIKE